MKKIFSMGIIMLVLANISLASAEVGGTVTKTITTPKTYTSSQAFLASEGTTCEVATDGCNTIMIQDGAFGATTLKYCAETPIYSCVKEKEEVLICTMQYAPVCGIDGVTYGNSCMSGDTAIAYENECKTMVDTTLYTKLEKNKNYVSSVKITLGKLPTTTLEKAIETADILIANTKLLKIVEKMQIERITKITFIQDIIQEVLASK